MLEIPITERQFTALMKVCGITTGTDTHKSMKLVFVEGKTTREVSAQVGLAYNTIAAAKAKVINRHATIDARIALLQEARG